MHGTTMKTIPYCFLTTSIYYQVTGHRRKIRVYQNLKARTGIRSVIRHRHTVVGIKEMSLIEKWRARIIITNLIRYMWMHMNS